MPRKPPPPHPAGAPRTPGSGRRKGTPNRRTVEMRALMGSLLEDVDYQYRLRADFKKRRVHPSIEALVWQMHLGKPGQQIEMSADVRVDERLAAERERLRHLDVGQLEALVAESEALVQRAIEAAQRRAQERTGPECDAQDPASATPRPAPDDTNE